MTTRWSDFDATPRGKSADPEIPPHASWCSVHRKLFRILCPWCVTLAAGGRMPLNESTQARTHVKRTFKKPEHVAKYEAAIVLRAKGISYYRIAKLVGVAVSTVHNWGLDEKEGA